LAFAGIVDEDVEAIEIVHRIVEPLIDRFLIRHIEMGAAICGYFSVASPRAYSLTSHICTLAPLSVKAFAMAQPMPEPPAVIMTR
jgi:hypothetical protein